MRKTEEILKAVSLDTSRAILKQLSKRLMTVRELRKKSKRFRNRVSFYKSLNRMVRLGIVRRRRKVGVRGFVYEPAIRMISIDLKDGKVTIKGIKSRMR